MRIGDRMIGQGYEPYVIAEIGVNHDGDAQRALALTRLAAEAGADAVKFQLFEADRLMSRAAKLAAYQARAGETDPVEMLRRLELPAPALEACAREATRLRIHAILSVFSVELVPGPGAPWHAYKTASPDIVNRPLLAALAATGRPLIVSTGASTPEEVTRAIGWLSDARDRLAILQCVSSYPTPPERASIGGVEALLRLFQGPVGYSDHTREEDTGVVALAAGACVLEKHFTYSRAAQGPDHAASLEPAQFARYVARTRDAHDRQALVGMGDPRVGPREKRVLDIEQDVRLVSRQSLVAVRDLPAGHVLSRGDLTIKRPGTGIPPHEMEAVVGRRLVAPVAADMPLPAGCVG
ncbi:MAG: N-acetylneuraminate synthase family protein [Phycisphaerales bacterium]|nr:N-acetylneuraminate synthase family protein [Phycisphaerales bacterium]